jgi:predicted murein hydrolase (TIGR00659 family)
VSPAVALGATLAAYWAALWIYRRCGRPALLNPVLVATLALIALLYATRTPYVQYMQGAGVLTWLLAPATVALAVPLYKQLPHVRSSAAATLVAVAAGCLTGIVSAVGLALMFGLPPEIVRSLASKSVTAPVAMPLAQELGGEPALAAVFGMLNAVAGVTIAGLWFRDSRRRRARGLGLGVSSHAIGTSYAFGMHESAGGFAVVGMGLNAILSSLLLPVLAHFWKVL